MAAQLASSGSGGVKAPGGVLRSMCGGKGAQHSQL